MAKGIRTLTPRDLAAIMNDPVSLELRDDLPELIPGLSATTFVTLARTLTKEQRLELLIPHAAPEQLRAVVDFDGWRGDRLHTPAARTWLSRVATCLREQQAPRGSLVSLMESMDMELWVLALMATTAVAEAEPDDDAWKDRALATMQSLATYESPDGNYIVGVPDDEIGREALAIIDAVYHDDLMTGAQLVRFIKYSLGYELEEAQYRWRAGRLADEGFPSWEEAMRLFAPISRNEARGEDTTSESAAPHASPQGQPQGGRVDDERLLSLHPRPMLAALLERLSPHERGVRGREFLLLVNELMAAQRFEPGDDGSQRRAVDQAQATLNLGLELLAAEVGEEDPLPFVHSRMNAIGMRGLFRVGYGPLARLRKAALALHKSGQVSLTQPGSLLDRPWGPWLRGLVEWFPERPAGPSDDPSKRIPGTTTMPMDSRAAVREATVILAQAGALARLVFDARGFKVDPSWVTRVDDPAKLRLGDLIRTALVHEQLPGSAGALAPLTVDDLTWARAHLLDARGQLVPALRDGLTTRLRSLDASAHADAIIETLSTRLVVELSGLEPDAEGAIDLGKVGGMLTIQRISVWLKTGIDSNADGS
jgi:hypothetical protein